MATKITGAGTEALEARVAVPSLDGYLADDRSFVPAVARTLAAIARHDKVVSPAELDVLMDFARGSVSPGLVGTIIFTALQDGVSLDRAIKDLASCSENATPEQREAAINSAMPILTLQGARARELAMRLAEALDQPSFESEFPRAEEWGFFDDLVDGARRTIGRGDAADAVAECGRSMGSVVLIEFYRSYRKGKLTRRELVERVREIEEQVLDVIRGRDDQGKVSDEGEKYAAAFVASADELVKQVKQRLALVDARVQFARKNLAEDIEEIVHNAGNSIERGIQDRTMTDDWKKAQVWESIARTQFGIDAELRISRALHRLNEDLRLFQEDLRLFEQEVGITGGAFFGVEHHSRLEGLMPPLRLATRIINTLDTAAETTLWGGGLGAAGAGAAAYFLGPAVVLPLVGAAAPYVVPALLLAGLFKWLKTPDERLKYAEISDKRKAFEKLVRDRLLAAQEVYESELERVRDDFVAAAGNLLTPIMLEAAAVERLPRLRKALVDLALKRATVSLRELSIKIKMEAVTTG